MSFAASPRNFHHLNKSNPNLTWFEKHKRHTTQCNDPSPKNCLLGDSHFERLSRPRLSPLFQELLPDYLNLAIGGDRVENILWRAQNNGVPLNPAKVIICGGTNNIVRCNAKEAHMIANTLMDIVSFLLTNFDNIQIAVMGILPRKESNKCQQADRINNIIRFKLPQKVTFIDPPKTLYGTGNCNNTYYEDSVHLNSKGYQTIFQALQPFLYSNRLSTPITSHTCQGTLSSMIWELARQSSLANHHHRRHQLCHLHHHHMPHHQLHHLHLHLHTVSMSSFHFTHHHLHHSLIQLHL